jgi:hypothetical protein
LNARRNVGLIVLGQQQGEVVLAREYPSQRLERLVRGLDLRDLNLKVPVCYGVVVGSSHTTVIDQGSMDMSPLKQLYFASTVAWLRYQLTDDAMMKALFLGPDCGYCKDTKAWLVQQKALK